MQGEKPFAPKAFYQVNLDDLVRQDNFYRRLNQELDLRWIGKETKQYYGKEGQKSIDPVKPKMSANITDTISKPSTIMV
ncbi:MAG: hypothetical protein ACI97X_002065 [Oceanospirillaceae bacterium]|jgi:hypothetical protein